MTDLLNYLLFIAIRNDIQVEFTDLLSPSTPDLSIPSERKIIINENSFIGVHVTFRFAHELAHILFGNDNQDYVYQFSIGTKKESERKAHKRALRIISRFVYNETPMEYRNYVDFMNAFNLPSSFENWVKDAIKAA